MAEDAPSAVAEVRVGTPLVDDDGWPMPPDDPAEAAPLPGPHVGATQ
jgi:hypothetical protein